MKNSPCSIKECPPVTRVLSETVAWCRCLGLGGLLLGLIFNHATVAAELEAPLGVAWYASPAGVKQVMSEGGLYGLMSEQTNKLTYTKVAQANPASAAANWQHDVMNRVPSACTFLFKAQTLMEVQLTFTTTNHSEGVSFGQIWAFAFERKYGAPSRGDEHNFVFSVMRKNPRTDIWRLYGPKETKARLTLDFKCVADSHQFTITYICDDPDPLPEAKAEGAGSDGNKPGQTAVHTKPLEAPFGVYWGESREVVVRRMQAQAYFKMPKEQNYAGLQYDRAAGARAYPAGRDFTGLNPGRCVFNFSGNRLTGVQVHFLAENDTAAQRILVQVKNNLQSSYGAPLDERGGQPAQPPGKNTTLVWQVSGPSSNYTASIKGKICGEGARTMVQVTYECDRQAAPEPARPPSATPPPQVTIISAAPTSPGATALFAPFGAKWGDALANIRNNMLAQRAFKLQSDSDESLCYVRSETEKPQVRLGMSPMMRMYGMGGEFGGMSAATCGFYFSEQKLTEVRVTINCTTQGMDARMIFGHVTGMFRRKYGAPAQGADPANPISATGEDVPAIATWQLAGPLAGTKASLDCRINYAIQPAVIELVYKCDLSKIVPDDAAPINAPTNGLPTAQAQAAGQGEDATGLKNAAALYSKVSPTIGLVTTRTGAGTCFLCDMAGRKYLVSNEHVTRGGTPKVKLLNGRELSFTNIEIAVGEDLVRFPLNSQETLAALSLTTNPPSVQDDVLVIGNSDGGGVATMTRGRVLGLGPNRLEVSAEFVHGNSGSPIINSNGNVCAVATYAVRQKDPKDWVKAGTRYNDIRRFGVTLNDVKWHALSLEQYNIRADILADLEKYTADMADLFYSDKYWDKVKRRVVYDFNDQKAHYRRCLGLCSNLGKFAVGLSAANESAVNLTALNHAKGAGNTDARNRDIQRQVSMLDYKLNDQIRTLNTLSAEMARDPLKIVTQTDWLADNLKNDALRLKEINQYLQQNSKIQKILDMLKEKGVGI